VTASEGQRTGLRFDRESGLAIWSFGIKDLEMVNQTLRE
jgi:hypothetical protein